MQPVFKLILFLTFFLSVCTAGYKLYRYLNNKITGSDTGWQLFGFSLLLIGLNMLLFFGGIYLFIKLYVFLVG
jgi:hypothetical protein